ncbi:MIR domain-containing protein [Aphanothece sacrum]|uniref:MIR domain-containing protein n=1 Tax=Aphanothece sacrum FPU1 TaxID=1920663 RepID=A0A401IMG5_APHSA|nr:MIR domain-containing protein [Aphanothece sacrum]GBF82454.1 hypothetical protein AsFPU1_3883 [Aphanothece sacrum FPU1]GBF84391.1 hypothetical protein AsFPU3_1440 [Aphanothece sacrum FPU3]
MDVQYGSQIKMRHTLTGFHLHSHPINYKHPNSSQQQQVTCFNNGAGGDDNDFWIVKSVNVSNPRDNELQAVKDGDMLRFEHILTQKNLHSHPGIPSPITGQQEVTCFGFSGSGDSNDLWKIEIEGGGIWNDSKRVRLIHVNTGFALHSHGGQLMNDLTAFQQEVTCFSGRDENDLWQVFNISFVGVKVPEGLGRNGNNPQPVRAEQTNQVAGGTMTTKVTVSPDGQLTAETHTRTKVDLKGFTGSVIVVIYNQEGRAHISGKHSFGVNGQLIPGGPSDRKDTWQESVPLEISSKANRVAIVHSHDPNVRVNAEDVINLIRIAIILTA